MAWRAEAGRVVAHWQTVRMGATPTPAHLSSTVAKTITPPPNLFVLCLVWPGPCLDHAWTMPGRSAPLIYLWGHWKRRRGHKNTSRDLSIARRQQRRAGAGGRLQVRRAATASCGFSSGIAFCCSCLSRQAGRASAVWTAKLANFTRNEPASSGLHHLSVPTK